MTIHAIYEQGVFRPLEPVELPESTHVIVTASDDLDPTAPRASAGIVHGAGPASAGLSGDQPNQRQSPATVTEERALRAMPRILRTLSQRVASGDHDIAARHNEHQP